MNSCEIGPSGYSWACERDRSPGKGVAPVWRTVWIRDRQPECFALQLFCFLKLYYSPPPDTQFLGFWTPGLHSAVTSLCPIGLFRIFPEENSIRVGARIKEKRLLVGRKVLFVLWTKKLFYLFIFQKTSRLYTSLPVWCIGQFLPFCFWPLTLESPV